MVQNNNIKMGCSACDKYPSILNPYKILGLNEYTNLNISTIKSVFKEKMKGNENPSIRLAYDMLVNSYNYNKINPTTFKVKKRDIFYYAHVNAIYEINILLENNKDLLYSKDNLGRTIFYLACRNGYYNLCKYLLNKGALIEESQLFGSTPLESAIFYGHENIAQLIIDYQENQKKYLNKILEEYTIEDFDNILKKDLNDFHHTNFFKFYFENHSRTTFNKISIFDKKKYDKIKHKFNKHYININNLTKLEKSSIGAMVGMAIGDAIGARVEFQPLNYQYNEIKDMGKDIAGKFKLKPGQWTDDTSMGLCLADSLIENKGNFDGHDFMLRLISWFFYGYNNSFKYDEQRPNKYSIGLGGNISNSFKQYISEKGKYEFTRYGDENTSGNGSIIRNAPIALCFHRDMKLALDISKKQSKVTHQGNEAAGCCQLLTFILVKILKGEDLKQILLNLKQEFKCEYDSVNKLAYSQQENNDPNKNWNWNVPKYEYSYERVISNPGYIGSYSMDAMAMALHILIKSNNFREAILKGVNLRGDADSLGAVIGQIAGAYYGIDGIPKDWIEILYKWDKNKEIALRGYILCNLFNKKDENEDINIYSSS